MTLPIAARWVMNVTFIKGLNAAFHRIGLVQYASDKLGHDLFIGAGG